MRPDLIVTQDGLASNPITVPLAQFAPAIFSFDFGPGRAIVTNLDNTVAQPVGGVDDFGLTARPAGIGEFIVILATGLGHVDPPAVTGNNSLDEEGNFVQRNVVENVRVFIGGVEATVFFAGLSPQFVGVYQLNVEIAAGTPAGDAVSTGDSQLGLVNSALSNFQFESLVSDVSYSENGDLVLKMTMKGVNPDLDPTQPVILNLAVENNIPQLLRSLQATRSIEDILDSRPKN